jgi:flagellar hook assembly protein FlgD
LFKDELLNNDGVNAMTVPTATLYTLSTGNAQEDLIIENVKCKIENYPNPFNPETTINYSLPEDVTNPVIEIFNIKGARVRELKIENVKCKMNSIIWDGRDNYRNQVSSGIYIYRLVDDGRILTSEKMILMK